MVRSITPDQKYYQMIAMVVASIQITFYTTKLRWRDNMILEYSKRPQQGLENIEKITDTRYREIE